MTTEPATPRTVRNSTTVMSSVVTVRRLAPAVTRARTRARCPPWHALGDRGHGFGAHGGEPVAAHELDEVAPVGPDVGERTRLPAEVGIDPPVVVVLGGEPVLQVVAVQQADRPDGPGGHTGAGLAPAGRSGRRRAPSPRRPAASAAAVRRRAVGARRRRAASRRPRACRPPGPPGQSRRAGGWGCRRGRRRRRGWRGSPRPSAKASLRAQGGGPRPGPVSGVEAATPTRRAPARRTARAWTSPMNPVPAMAARSGRPAVAAAGACVGQRSRSSPPRL